MARGRSGTAKEARGSGSSAEEKEDGREKTRENIDCPCESRGEFYISFRNSGMIYKLTINN